MRCRRIRAGCLRTGACPYAGTGLWWGARYGRRGTATTGTWSRGMGARGAARWSAGTRAGRAGAHARRCAGTVCARGRRRATTGTRWTGTDAARRARWRRDGRARWRHAGRRGAARYAETDLCWEARSATTGTTGRMTDAVAAKWNVGGTAVEASAQGYVETGCARAQRSATTGTPTQEMDAAGTAWWRRGSRAVELGRTGNAGDPGTRVWEDAEVARGRQDRQRSATTGTLWAGTDAAHHARS